MMYVYIFFQFLLKCLVHGKSQFREKMRYFPLRNFRLYATMLQHLIIQFLLNYLSSGRLREVKKTENFKLLALKVVAVAYERRSLTRGSKCSYLTWKFLVFLTTGG